MKCIPCQTQVTVIRHGTQKRLMILCEQCVIIKERCSTIGEAEGNSMDLKWVIMKRWEKTKKFYGPKMGHSKEMGEKATCQRNVSKN
jgi:hypothetical protein